MVPCPLYTMTKPTHHNKEADKTADTNTAMTMQTTQTAPTTVATVSGHGVLENPNGTSHRLVWYAHNADGSTKAWDPAHDLSLTDLKQSSAGLEAIAKMVAGGLHGSPTLIVTTPTEKLGYENGTGTFGYVFYDHQDDIEVDVNGIKVLVHVDPADIPSHGVARVHLDAGQLYRKDWEPVFTARDADPFMYWYARAGRTILNGHSVSVSVGPKMLDRAKAVEAVLKATDKVAANNERQYAGRRSSALNNEIRNAVEASKEMAAATGTTVIPNTSDMMVPVYMSTEVCDLSAWPKSQMIRICKDNGMSLRPLSLKDGSPEVRMAIAKTMISNHYFVDRR